MGYRGHLTAFYLVAGVAVAASLIAFLTLQQSVGVAQALDAR